MNIKTLLRDASEVAKMVVRRARVILNKDYRQWSEWRLLQTITGAYLLLASFERPNVREDPTSGALRPFRIWW